MNTTLDRAIEDGKARGINPALLEALRSLVEEGLLEVWQTESGAFVSRITKWALNSQSFGASREALTRTSLTVSSILAATGTSWESLCGGVDESSADGGDRIDDVTLKGGRSGGADTRTDITVKRPRGRGG